MQPQQPGCSLAERTCPEKTFSSCRHPTRDLSFLPSTAGDWATVCGHGCICPSHLIMPHPLLQAGAFAAVIPHADNSSSWPQGRPVVKSRAKSSFRFLSNLDISFPSTPGSGSLRAPQTQTTAGARQTAKSGQGEIACLQTLSLSSSGFSPQAIWKHLLRRPPRTRTIPCCETLDAGC
ncbi:hypothetical protein M440DRAFT_1084006 [Trichoderma longibrachiatum ATCC 18648]|uniref:Uncharacterized protein n=1 Tax=Trichoderma longibrachiatum ATCC 18648 TaxID=983965 RepID=A0A2T4BU05_TRILO|nr:hypothetical protein M440DRAFT_1084006 [Trichoderma longibrachiatum ATCC 18648]